VLVVDRGVVGEGGNEVLDELNEEDELHSCSRRRRMWMWEVAVTGGGVEEGRLGVLDPGRSRVRTQRK